MEPSRVCRELPPLILYPFDHRPDPKYRPQPNDYESLRDSGLEARYDEFRMLCLIGKDLNRWLEQCVEVASRDAELACLSEGDFIAALLFAPPASVLQKMRIWGVRQYQTIFSRAIGLNSVFPHPPSASDVSESFLRGFQRYADALYDARAKAQGAAAAQEITFAFEIYASGEYSSHLESIWAE
jgi:hypothetical protein